MGNDLVELSRQGRGNEVFYILKGKTLKVPRSRVLDTRIFRRAEIHDWPDFSSKAPSRARAYAIKNIDKGLRGSYIEIEYLRLTDSEIKKLQER